ncbi:MAG TPA: peptide ligase PGM1-related protein [Candidatus Acidoferrum sp.]|nr:peptide ligase PGM1-related protein [Candidatus Acidoferrum sp.]
MDIGFQGRRQVVILPSMTIDIPEPMRAAAGPMLMTREERLLCLLLMLKDPAVSLVYVSSLPLTPSLVDYWLQQVPQAGAVKRLTLFAVDDASPHPLSQKLVESPGALERLRSLIVDPTDAYLLPFHAHELDQRVATGLGIPMFGVAPELAARFGSKSGARAVFAACGIPHANGVEGIRTVGDLARAVRSLVEGRPDPRDLVIKQDHAGGGHGNALVTVDQALSDVEVRDRIFQLRPDDPRFSPEMFLTRLEQKGGVVEERLIGDEVWSPSVQLHIHPDGKVLVNSTHEQVLGGATGQSYAGCRFPADGPYAATIARHADAIGHYLADHGVIGYVGIDFVVTRSGGGDWHAFAIEINPRMTGTVHHFETLRHLTRGVYDADAGLFRLSDRSSRHYVGSDDLSVDGLKNLRPGDLPGLVRDTDIAWNPTRQRGVLFHTISAVAVTGTVGVTAIGESPDDAESLHRGAGRLLESLACGPDPVRNV